MRISKIPSSSTQIPPKLIRKTLLVHLSKGDEVKQIYRHHTVLSYPYGLLASIPPTIPNHKLHSHKHTQSSPVFVPLSLPLLAIQVKRIQGTEKPEKGTKNKWPKNVCRRPLRQRLLMMLRYYWFWCCWFSSIQYSPSTVSVVAQVVDSVAVHNSFEEFSSFHLVIILLH